MAILDRLFEHSWLILASVAVLYVISKIAAYARLRQFQGPFATGFSDWPHSIAQLSPACHEWYETVTHKYGPIARVAPNVLITGDPDVWVHCNIKPSYKRSDWYYHATRIEHRRDNVFSQTDNILHEKRRKQMAPGYSGRENQDLESSVDARLEELLKLIRSKYVSSQNRVVTVDLSKKIQYFTLDVISTVGLGKSFGMLDSDTDVNEYLKSSEEGLQIGAVALALGFSWLAQVPGIGYFIAPKPSDTNGFGKMMATCFRYVDERAANPTNTRSDMLASFIRHGLSGDELRSEALEQIIAGSDTTAGGIRGTMLHIMTNPLVYAKLQKEIDEAVERGKAPAAGEGIITTAEAKTLPYLQAVIREGLRVFPPVVNIFSRDVPSGGDTVLVDGKPVFLPGGTSIGYSAYPIHHSKKIYGEDAKAFRPERWFEKDPARLANMTRINDLVFGHGKWQCLGKPIAQMELCKVIFEV